MKYPVLDLARPVPSHFEKRPPRFFGTGIARREDLFAIRPVVEKGPISNPPKRLPELSISVSKRLFCPTAPPKKATRAVDFSVQGLVFALCMGGFSTTGRDFAQNEKVFVCMGARALE